MMSCTQTIIDYGLRSIGYGERLLPRSDFTLCEQFTLIGSGLIWNVYFGLLSLVVGFFLALALAMGKYAGTGWVNRLCCWVIFLFRGSPLFIQFFFAYFFFIWLKSVSPFFQPFTSATLGALLVLILNTAAYSAEIFYGALQSLPKGDTEAADAYGIYGWTRFRRIVLPTTLRLAWPSYTNEAIFLFHSTTLVFIAGFPAKQQKGDALYYAGYFADKTFNPFIPYPILAFYFIILTIIVIWTFNGINRRLNAHLPQQDTPRRLKIRPKLFR